VSNSYRTSKGKADRKAHRYILHSTRTILQNRIEYFKKQNALLYPEGGPVLHLTPEEYLAQKIAEAIAKYQEQELQRQIRGQSTEIPRGILASDREQKRNAPRD